MDEIVKTALAKWPNVPNCYAWLGLDARGNWYMRDDAAQAAGPFCSASITEPARRTASKGTLLMHDKLIDFIQRNYESDAQGQWFFQNGPQRVYVELEATPFIWRVDAGGDFAVTAHTRQPVRVQRCLLDEHGRVYLQTEIGFGLVHTLDMLNAADAIEMGLWVPQDVMTHELQERFDYVRSPDQRHKMLLKQ